MLVVELVFTPTPTPAPERLAARPTPTPERLAARPAHRAALGRLHAEGKLFAAGPWADDQGALLVFAVERAELEEILEADPYYRSTPGVEVSAIRAWAPIVGA